MLIRRSDLAADPRYRVAERRDLRDAVRFGVLIGAVVLGLDLVMHGADSPTLAVVNSFSIVALLLLFTSRARRRPHVAGFAIVVTLVWATVVPELVDPSAAPLVAGYVALIIVASAVFLPWGPDWHAAWLCVAGASGLAAAVLASRGPDETFDFGVLIVASIATSAVGNVLIRRRRERVHLQQSVLRAQRAELRRMHVHLRDVASRDSLTDLGNRRRLSEDIAEFEARLARGALTGVSAIMVDLDHFKAYNDRAGHPAGDEVLRVVAAAIRGAVREIDRVYRYGGEEILVLLEEPTREGALLAARRILDAVRRLALPHVAQPGHVLTISAGAASQRGSGVTVWHVIEAADQALYEAKSGGRDRAVLARPLPPADAPDQALRRDEDAGVEPFIDPGIHPGVGPRVGDLSSVG